MKARVKATGEIVEVIKDYDLRESTVVEFYTNIEDPTDVFEKEELEFSYDSEFIDYWTRLEHQYAGMAMQGILSNQNIGADVAYIVSLADEVAHALVGKMKEERK